MTRVALITGATAGMGLEIARQLAAHGMKVIVGARDVERGHAIAAELCAAGGGKLFRFKWMSPIPSPSRARHCG